MNKDYESFSIGVFSIFFKVKLLDYIYYATTNIGNIGHDGISF